MTDKNEKDLAMHKEDENEQKKLRDTSASSDTSAQEEKMSEEPSEEKALPAAQEDKKTEEEENKVQKDKKSILQASSKDDKPVIDKRNKSLKRSAWLSVILMIAIVIAINVILNSIVGTKWQFDWTANKAATLGEVSKQILKENDKDVKIIVLADRDSFKASSAGADLSFLPNLLDEYADASGGHVSVVYENPVKNPAIVTAIDPNNVHQLRQGQIVVSNPDYSKLKVLNQQDLVKISQQYYVTGYVAEEAITGAIRLVTSDFTPVVYLTKGHGEADADKHFTILKALLEQNNYLVKSFDSVTASGVPDDAELLLMLSPQSDISAAEEDVYMSFLKKGGSLLILMDYSTAPFPNLNALLREFNLKITTDKVQENDTQRSFSNDPSSFVCDINNTKLYTQNKKMDFAVVIDSRAITTADSSQEWIKTEPVLTTSDQATRLIGGDKANVSQPGKQTVAMFSENTGYIDGSTVTKSAKVAVFGSAYPFTDSILYNYMNSSGNYLLANSTLAYMSNMADHADQALLIQPKGVVSYAIAPKSQSVVQILSVVFMALVPLALLVTATAVYQKRKRL